ncbi:MAG: hypothetical protein ACYTEK_16550 [Planctomycetota bacterium]|jgi:hypothetical protein
MTTDAYFDMRNLSSKPWKQGFCPVSGCYASLGKADSRWGQMPYCPSHRIRIHQRSQTFVYYNGPDALSKREAALRNIVFEREYFDKHILGNAAKAETHRICHETSEDAVTWNVFARLARTRRLASLLSTFTRSPTESEPQLYLWGLPIHLDGQSAPELFPPLDCARKKFESGIRRFWTEPDIMLYVPEQWLILIEAKFTSGNTIAFASTIHDRPGEKPKSRDGILKRYAASELPDGVMLTPSLKEPFYSQLHRNLVFAIYMSDQLKVEWGLVNLVCDGQFRRHRNKPEYGDPTEFIHGLLPRDSRDRFLRYSWERLYLDHVAEVPELKYLAEYLYYKSANGAKALAV